MACGGLKYEGVIFNNKRELIEYISKGVKPETNTSIQEVKNDIIKDALKSKDINAGINSIVNVAEITKGQRALLNEAFGADTTQAYLEYVETGNITSPNKNAIRPIFQDISTNIKDIVSSVEYANSQLGIKPIDISPEITEFTNKIKINDSQRFIPTQSGSESTSTTGVPQLEKEKWFNPRSEEGAQSATGKVQAIQGPREGNIDRQTTRIIDRKSGGITNREDNADSENGTARDSGVSSDGHPKRIQLATGEYVSWDPDTREWTNIVRNVSGDRWGTVRPASQRERAAAAEQRANRIITAESNPDTAVNLIFGQGDPISNLRTLKAMGYIDLNPTELYNKLKAQFDNNRTGIDQIANAIGANMYPVLFLENNIVKTLSNEDSILLSKETEYPGVLENPKQFFSNIGFAPAQVELLSFIYGLIPDAYNKTNTAIKVAIELMYPEQTGFNIMNILPYTKEEMYDIMTKYQNENIGNNLGDVFIHEYVNQEPSFGMERNKEVLDTIINKAKSLQIELPQQYENYFQATNKFKTFFKKGQKLRNKEDVLYVHDINYSNPEDITYVLWHPQEDAYYEMDMLKMDLFEEDTESDLANMEDNAIAVINALEQIGTMVRFMPKQDDPGIFNVFNNEIYLDSRKLTNRLLYHEAAHAVFIKGIRLNKDNVTKLHAEIANVLRNGTPQERALAGRLDFFVQRYTEAEAEAAMMPLDELRAHEFLAELVAQLAYNKAQISTQSERSIIEKIIEFFRNLFGYNQNLNINNIDDVIEMINGISNKLRTGETINFSDYKNMMSDKNINQGVLYAMGDIYTGDTSRVLTPGKKIGIIFPDGKGATATVGLTGTTNNGDGFTDLEFADGRTERYKTEHLVLREGVNGNLFISMMPAASQKANPTHQGNVLSDSDKQMLKEFALEQKADGTYEYSINDIYSLIKDDVQVDHNIFVDIINGYREEQALAAAKNADPISDDVYNDFVDNNNNVPEDVLESIADKVATRKKLSKREEAIFVGRKDDINKIIADYATSKIPSTPVPPATGPQNDKVLQDTLFALRKMSVTREVADILRGVNDEKLITFDSGETIEKKIGESPENSQLAKVFETKKALEEGRKHLATLKKYFGTNQFNKIIELLDTGQAGMVGTEVLFVVMSQDLTHILEEDPSSNELVKAMRKKLNKSMQAYARNASIILNLQRMANINPDTIFSSSSIASSILTPDAKEARESLLDALYQEELDDAYESYEKTREEYFRNSKTNPYTKPKTTTTTSTKRKKSKPSDWVPRGNGFLDSAIRTVRDFINKNC